MDKEPSQPRFEGSPIMSTHPRARIVTVLFALGTGACSGSTSIAANDDQYVSASKLPKCTAADFPPDPATCTGGVQVTTSGFEGGFLSGQAFLDDQELLGSRLVASPTSDSASHLTGCQSFQTDDQGYFSVVL